MKTLHHFAFIFLLIIVACKPVKEYETRPMQFSEAINPEEVGFSSQRLSRIDSLLEKFVTEGNIPNAISFVARHGKIVHYKAYGYKNIEQKEALKKTDLFRMASQTKAITSVALMTLYEEGKFLLDDPLAMYIPSFENMNVLVKLDEKTGAVETRPAKAKITIRHLLAHTSGIHYGNSLYAKENIPSLHSVEPITIEQVVEKIAQQPLSHDPGEGWTYGMNTDVMGRLIEVLSGKSLDVALRERVLEPLGMNGTRFYIPAGDSSRFVTLYSKVHADSALKLSDNALFQYYAVSGARSYFSGGAGLTGPIEDYAKFCQMLLNRGEFNGNRVISRKTLEVMTLNQIGEFEVWGSHDKFGLGFEIMTEEANRHLLGTIGSFKWGGMYATDYLIDPKEDLIMLVYTNVFPYRGPNLHERFRIAVYQALIN